MTFSFLWVIGGLFTLTAGVGAVVGWQERRAHKQAQRDELMRKLSRYRVADNRSNRTFPERAA